MRAAWTQLSRCMSTKTQRSFGILRVTSGRAIAQPETELFRRDRWPSMTAVMASPTAIARRFLLNAISPSVNQSNRTRGARQLEDCYAQEISSRLHQFAQSGRRRFGPRSLARRRWSPGVSGRARSSVSGVCGLAGTTCHRRTGCGAVHGQSDPRHRGSPRPLGTQGARFVGIALLYLCCSGSFLGFAFAFGQVLGHNFAAAGESHAQASLHAAEMAFIGPLLGSFVAHLRRQTGGPGRRWSYHLGGVGRSNGRRVLPTVSHCYGSIGDIGPVVRGRLWMQAGRGVLGTTDRSWFPKPDNASVRIRPGWSTSGRLKNGLDSVTGTRPALLGHGHSYVGDTGVMKNL